MNFGMLWYDNNPKRDLGEKIERASSYYEKKFGRAPNECVVNPAMLGNGKEKSQALKVTSSATILPNHLWIGFDTRVKQVGKSV